MTLESIRYCCYSFTFTTHILRHSSGPFWPASKHWLSSAAGSESRSLLSSKTKSMLFMMTSRTCVCGQWAWAANYWLLSAFVWVFWPAEERRPLNMTRLGVQSWIACFSECDDSPLFCNYGWLGLYLELYKIKMVDIPKPVFHSVQNKYVSCDGNFQPALDWRNCCYIWLRIKTRYDNPLLLSSNIDKYWSCKQTSRNTGDQSSYKLVTGRRL